MEYMPSVLQQTVSFVYSAGLGFCFGLIYDFFRIIFILLTGSDKKLSTARDIIYILFCLCVHFIFILVMCSGRVMLFTFAGEVIGAYAYFKTLSRELFLPLKRTIIKIRSRFKTLFFFIKRNCDKLSVKIKKIIRKSKKNTKISKKRLEKSTQRIV